MKEIITPNKTTYILFCIALLSVFQVNAISTQQIDTTNNNADWISCIQEGNCILSSSDDSDSFEWDGTLINNIGTGYIGGQTGYCQITNTQVSDTDYFGISYNNLGGGVERTASYTIGNISMTALPRTATDVSSSGTTNNACIGVTQTQDYLITYNENGRIEVYNITGNSSTPIQFINSETAGLNPNITKYYESLLSYDGSLLYYSDDIKIHRFSFPNGATSTFTQNFTNPIISFADSGGKYGFVAEDDGTIYYFNGGSFIQIGVTDNQPIHVQVMDESNREAIIITNGEIYKATTTAISKLLNTVGGTVSFSDCVPQDNVCYYGNINSLSIAEDVLTEEVTTTNGETLFTESIVNTEINQFEDAVVDDYRNLYLVGTRTTAGTGTKGRLISAEVQTDGFVNTQTRLTFDETNNETPRTIDFEANNNANNLVIGTDSEIIIYENVTSAVDVSGTPTTFNLVGSGAPFQDIEIMFLNETFMVMGACGTTFDANLTFIPNSLFLLEFTINSSGKFIFSTNIGDDCRSLSADDSSTDSETSELYVNSGESGLGGIRQYTHNISTQNLDLQQEITIHQNQYLGDFQGVKVDKLNDVLLIAGNNEIEVYDFVGSSPPILVFNSQCSTTGTVNGMDIVNSQILGFGNGIRLSTCNFGISEQSTEFQTFSTNTKPVNFQNHIFRNDRTIMFTQDGQIHLLSFEVQEPDDTGTGGGIVTNQTISDILNNVATLGGAGDEQSLTLIALIFIGAISFGGMRLTNSFGDMGSGVIGGLIGLFISTLFFFFLDWLPLIAMVLLIILCAFGTVVLFRRGFGTSA